MNNQDSDNRKNLRRDNIKQRRFDKRLDNIDQKDQVKLNKQFKRNKRQIIEEEIWEEWNNEIR